MWTKVFTFFRPTLYLTQSSMSSMLITPSQHRSWGLWWHLCSAVQWTSSVLSYLTCQQYLTLMLTLSLKHFCLASLLYLFFLISFAHLSGSGACLQVPWHLLGPLFFSLDTLFLSGLIDACGYNYKLHTQYSDLCLNPRRLCNSGPHVPLISQGK